MIEATYVYAIDFLALSMNNSWKRVVKEASLEPLEAGASKAELEQGHEASSISRRPFAREPSCGRPGSFPSTLPSSLRSVFLS